VSTATRAAPVEAPRPVAGADTAPFWTFTQARELRVQRCAACAALRWPPGPVCPHCWAPEHEWTPLSGRGVVQSWVVFHRQYHPAFPTPYTVAVVELAEGPRMEGQLVDAPADAVRWRAPVHVIWQERNGFVVPAFALGAEPEETA
jgi:uncharacterized protein